MLKVNRKPTAQYWKSEIGKSTKLKEDLNKFEDERQSQDFQARETVPEVGFSTESESVNYNLLSFEREKTRIIQTTFNWNILQASIYNEQRMKRSSSATEGAIKPSKVRMNSVYWKSS